MQTIFETIKENFFELATAAGTIIAILLGTRKKSTKTEKIETKLEKLKEKQNKDTQRMLKRQEKIEVLKGENKNAASK